MKNQVLSIEQMWHLKDLGVDMSNASISWFIHHAMGKESKSIDILEDRLAEVAYNPCYEVIPTFTLQDIIELLPEYISVNDEQSYDSEAELFINKRLCRYLYWDCEGYPLYTGSKELGGNVIESAYNLLCWCAENGYLNNNKTE